MYNEPDWSSLTVAGLLEKAQKFAKKAYGNSLRSYSFIERILDRIPRGTKGGVELAELMGKAQQVYRSIVEIQQSITHITDTLFVHYPHFSSRTILRWIARLTIRHI